MNPLPISDDNNSISSQPKEPRRKSRNIIENLRELKKRHSNIGDFETPFTSSEASKNRLKSVKTPKAPKPTQKSDYAPQTIVMSSSNQCDPSDMKIKSSIHKNYVPRLSSINENINSPPECKRFSILPPLLYSNQTKQRPRNSVRYAGAPRLSLTNIDLGRNLSNSDENLSSQTEDDKIEPRILKSVAINNKPRPSLISMDPLRCRICLVEQGEELDGESLISPCRCKGTVGLLHASCLQEWLVTARSTKCELCGYRYLLKRSRFPQRRATMREQASSIKIWLSSKMSQRHIIGDLILTSFMGVATVVIVYFCLIGALYFHEIYPFSWKTFGLIGLAATLISCFIVWTLLSILHHWNSYQSARLQRLELMRLQEQQILVDEIRDCTVLPRPRGSSVFLMNSVSSDCKNFKEEEEPLKAALRTGLLQPVEEVSELSTSFNVEKKEQSHDNCCSPTHHTKMNISVHSTDIIL